MQTDYKAMELNWHCLFFDQLTKSQAVPAHWSLADVYMINSAYCNALLLAHWSVHQKLNHVSSVQFSYVAQFTP